MKGYFEAILDVSASLIRAELRKLSAIENFSLMRYNVMIE